MVGFCEAEAKLLGPVHAYVEPPTVVAVSDKVNPEQTGVLLDAVGDAGIVLMVTEVVAVLLTHPVAMEVAVTE